MDQVTRILQLTDLHLFGKAQTKMVGINPLQTLQSVLTKISTDTTRNSPSLVVLTGDVSQDFSPESYKIAADALKIFSCPIVATMGNHDHTSSFTKIFGEPTRSISIDTTNWHILVLNSHLSGHVYGQLAESELNFLQKNLDQNLDRPTVIFLHHHVLPSGSHWIDKINLINNEQFLEIIDRYKNIKAVIYGHVHQETTVVRNNVTFLSTPSTSWQFAVKNYEFKLDTLMPGYRWIDLYSNGTIQTAIVRIPHNDKFVPDISSKGY